MEILVMGDGKFVFAVLNAVASVNSYGQLGALGGMLGLLLMVMRGIMTPSGPSVNLAPVLASIVIFWVMFIPRVDRVSVSEVMPAPGQATPRTFVVDNVPFGLAATGYMVSNIGIKVTGLYDTIMGRATDNTRVGTGGLGRNLMLISGLQTMINDPRFADTGTGTGEYSNYRRNMLAFIQDCVLPPAQNGHVLLNTVLQSPIEDGLFGSAFGGDLRPTRWVSGPPGALDSQYLTCAGAQSRLESGLSTNALPAGFDNAAEARGSDMRSEEIMGAFASYAGEGGLNAQRMMASHMVSSLVSEAALRGSLSPQDAQAVTMLEEASLRRSVSWAAEENLFIRVARPMLGFFEALFYALGPIMAFVVMLGPAGWGLVVKYMMLTVWVALWFPMLSIANLYSNMRMEAYFEQIGNLANTSPHQLEMIANEAISTLGATSALVAATPALAMSLIYGGAVSMSHLAGRLQHNDVVDETKMTPQASTIAPVVQGGSYAQANDAHGVVRTGAAGITLASGQDLTRLASSTQTEGHRLMASGSQAIYQSAELQAALRSDSGHAWATNESSQYSNQFMEQLRRGSGTDAAKANAYNYLNSLDEATRRNVLHNVGTRGSASVSVQGGTPGAGALGIGVTGRVTAEGSVGYNEVSDQSSGRGTTNSHSQAATATLREMLSKDTGLQTAAAAAVGAEYRQLRSESGSTGISAADGQRMETALSEISEGSRMYAQGLTMSSRSGVMSNVEVSQLARNMHANGDFGTYGARAADIVAASGLDAALKKEDWINRLNNSNVVGSNGQAYSREQIAGLASILTLVQNSDTIAASQMGAAAGVATDVLSRNTALGGLVTGDVHANSGVGGRAEDATGLLDGTSGLSGAPGVSRGGISGQVAGLGAAADATYSTVQNEATTRLGEQGVTGASQVNIEQRYANQSGEIDTVFSHQLESNPAKENLGRLQPEAPPTAPVRTSAPTLDDVRQMEMPQPTRN
ncbi:conjugal transfer protein TraG N-terminal domain-containing protein [Luteimonas sp. MHLX1A]|uniref:conjugal transfer protein TraG N-terminal domain-containing protein n=1 Tax=Alterluteimonas muca TaxID=2878684 RepID=UPI001E302361|nr:conjugal transfer protein TraG N-terminal domain-containing protein [Luteimonas sp. MHLX1A]MCD9046852.1 conjugal transfer protein TraG N-terminal domain-containing protein [Luteimonas sp. MHLX1A]